MDDLIKQHRNEGVLTIKFDRPDKLNALNNSMYTQLADMLLAADDDEHTRVIVITGGTSCFTSGNDLADFLTHPPTHLDSPAFRLMRVVIHLQKPLIAAVCGAAIGIGTTLLLHCDQVLVTHDARLRMPFVNLALCPEFGATLLLPRLLGQARAARLLLWGEGFDGETAVAWGVANEMFADGDQCLEAAQACARRLLLLPEESLRLTRHMLRQSSIAELENTIRQENLSFIERLASEQAQTALRALLDRGR
ncbi:MAG TPA: enoyl-CoA hydratase-related protein [Pseudomonas sp.]|jgi:enoyl-CoA hydratase/carnithine racemase